MLRNKELEKKNKKIFEWYNFMDQQQENNYGSGRLLILGPFLTEMDIQAPLVQTMDRITQFSRK
jgi:hypothetical protein